MEENPSDPPAGGHRGGEHMLAITREAMDVIARVSAHETTAPESGVRIAPRDGRAPLEVSVVHGPSAGDRVYERRGARLYFAPHTMERVSGGRLDAVVDDDDGRVTFVLRAAA
jgi:hypothetical protein